MSTQSSNSFVSSLQLVAVVTAVACARDFVRQTLLRWQVPEVVETAVLITSELVTNAVKTTGSTSPRPDASVLAAVPLVRLQISIVGGDLILEVWDTSPEPPMLRQQYDLAEHGRGLFIVHMESDQWGSYFPKAGGKVVWARLTLPVIQRGVVDGHLAPDQDAQPADRVSAGITRA